MKYAYAGSTPARAAKIMIVDQYNWESPDVINRLKKLPPIFRHFNYSLSGDRAYEIAWLSENTRPQIRAKTRYVKRMFAFAHGIQIGQLRIYFSNDKPVGLFHPDCGPLCMDNFWDRITAYHLNRVNKNLDKRLSMEHFYQLINHYLREESKKDIKLYIPNVDDWEMRTKTRDFDYITDRFW